eukprot:364833-Chlamydomonas_euryale.AAC.3
MPGGALVPGKPGAYSLDRLSPTIASPGGLLLHNSLKEVGCSTRRFVAPHEVGCLASRLIAPREGWLLHARCSKALDVAGAALLPAFYAYWHRPSILSSASRRYTGAKAGSCPPAIKCSGSPPPVPVLRGSAGLDQPRSCCRLRQPLWESFHRLPADAAAMENALHAPCPAFSRPSGPSAGAAHAHAYGLTLPITLSTICELGEGLLAEVHVGQIHLQSMCRPVVHRP